MKSWIFGFWHGGADVTEWSRSLLPNHMVMVSIPLTSSMSVFYYNSRLWSAWYNSNGSHIWKLKETCHIWISIYVYIYPHMCMYICIFVCEHVCICLFLLVLTSSDRYKWIAFVFNILQKHVWFGGNITLLRNRQVLVRGRYPSSHRKSAQITNQSIKHEKWTVNDDDDEHQCLQAWNMKHEKWERRGEVS